jgi:type II secretory pathway pseudopilin PulG
MRGYSLAEAVFVLGILAILVAVAFPALAHSRARVNVVAAKNAFAATHSVARQVAAQYGRLSRLHLDPEGDRFWVTVDTAARPGVTALDTVGPVVWVGSLFGGVEIDGRRRTFCFDPRGLATPRSDCDLPNATVVFRRGRAVDTVTVSRLGRLLR